MTHARFDRIKKIIQREVKVENLSTFEYILLDGFLNEIRRSIYKVPYDPRIDYCLNKITEGRHKGRPECAVKKCICKCSKPAKNY